MKKLFIITILILAYFSNELSKDIVQSMEIQNLINPYSQDNDFFSLIRVHEPLNQTEVKDILLQTAAQSDINLMVLEIDSETQTHHSVYWYLTDAKYFERVKDSFEIDSFSIFNQTHSNRIDHSAYTTKSISKKYAFHLYPLSDYKGDSSSSFIIFSSDEASIASFFSTLDAKHDLIYSISNRSIAKPNPIRNVLMSIFTNANTFFAFSLVFLYVFYLVNRDRRNQAIQLLHGYTRLEYYSDFYKTILKTIVLIFGLQFLVNFFISINKYLFIGLQVFFIYTIYFLIYAVLIGFLFIIISYALSKIQYHSYIHGYTSGKQLTIVLNLLKFASTLILVFSIFSTANALTLSYRLYRTIKNNESRARNIYSFQINAHYLDTIVEKNDELVTILSSEYDLLLLDNHQFNADEHKRAALYSKIITVNPSFIETQTIDLASNDSINSRLSNVIYTKKNDLSEVEHIKSISNPFCEDATCSHSEVILLSDDASIHFINTNPYQDLRYLDKDFILVVSDIPQFISSYLLYIETDEEIQAIQSMINSFFSEELIKLEKTSEAWDVSLKLSFNELSRSTITVIEFFLLVFLITQTYYRILFDKTRNEDAIRWLHGVSSFRESYHSFINQTLTSILSVFLMQYLLSNSVKSVHLMYLLLSIIMIESFSLIIARSVFYRDLLNNIKERHLL